MTDGWKNLLLENGIQSILSAAPWQRGRIERHGAVIKDMLDRMDNEQAISDAQHFDEALVQCFRAKNTMSVVDGYSPEQAVLGRASKLPASIVSDETSTAHLNSQGAEDLSSSRFQRQLELRSAARAAFAKADNNQALRRALLRQSRGVSHTWACGQLCMYWDKRRSPNMLEKGRWNGPAQVVCQESRTIIWITHLNRLLRCAQENLRPVSMREFQQHSTFAQTSTSDQLAQMSKQLQNKLKERSGLFQYLDLSEIGPSTEDDDDNPSQNNLTENNSQGQPEEEPYRRLPSTQTLRMQNLMPCDCTKHKKHPCQNHQSPQSLREQPMSEHKVKAPMHAKPWNVKQIKKAQKQIPIWSLFTMWSSWKTLVIPMSSLKMKAPYGQTKILLSTHAPLSPLKFLDSS